MLTYITAKVLHHPNRINFKYALSISKTVNNLQIYFFKTKYNIGTGNVTQFLLTITYALK